MNPNKSFIYFISTITVILLFIGSYRYYQYMIERNFIVEVQTACDIKTENCFSVEDDLSYGQNPYKKLTLTARYVPVCLEEHTCENFSCPEIISEGNICEITYCSDDTIDEGEECVGPNPEDDYIK